MRRIFYIIALFVTFSCDDALFNSGDIVTKNIVVTSFKEIYIDDVFNIILIQDDTCMIEAKGGSNLLPNLEFKVNEEKKLNISDNNKARWSRDYDKIELYISVDTLNFLKLTAPCNVISQNTLTTLNFRIWSITDYAEYDIALDCLNFYFANNSHSGGIMNVRGESTNFSFWARGSFKVNAEDLISNNVKVNNESMADCNVHVTDTLKVEIYRDGNVYYKGNPKSIEYVNERAKEQLIKID